MCLCCGWRVCHRGCKGPPLISSSKFTLNLLAVKKQQLKKTPKQPKPTKSNFQTIFKIKLDMLKEEILITQPYDSPSHSLRRSHGLSLPKSMDLLKSQQKKNCHILFLIVRCYHPAATPFLESGIDYWNFINILLCCEFMTYSVSSTREAPFSLFVLHQCLVFQIRRAQLGWI